MSKSYRVHIHDHLDQGRWLAQHDFASRPGREQIVAALPVLNEPGRYEVRINLVSGGEEYGLSSWLEGELAAGTVQVKRDGIVQETFRSPDPVRNSNDAFAWLLRHQGQSVDWAIKHEGWEITDPQSGPSGHYHDPSGRYDYCDDSACPRIRGCCGECSS